MSIEQLEGRPISFTEVTLRDGMQQDDISESGRSVESRTVAFENLIDAGMKRIEIGHLGNEDGLDVAFAREVVGRITEAEAAGSDRYEGVELQVLFGTQQHLIERGIKALDGFDRDRVFVHVYDRISPGLRALASNPYSVTQSGWNVVEAAQIAIDNGFTRFSISGEGATDTKLLLDDVVEFYTAITDKLFEQGATEVNCNLANTFGLSTTEDTFADLYHFNREVKRGRDNVTTSVHVHNDVNDAPGYAITAVSAGFDRIEGTMIGMGERTGNVAVADVITRLLENARIKIERDDNGNTKRHLGHSMLTESIWKQRFIEPSIVTALGHFYASCIEIADTFGTHERFEKTSLGNPSAYDAGSGPHAHANREFLKDPVKKPLWENYGYVALVHAMQGRPEAIGIIQVDPERIKAITIDTHAAGKSTRDVLAEKVEVAPVEERQVSEAMARERMARITARVSTRTTERYPSSDADVRAFHAGLIDPNEHAYFEEDRAARRAARPVVRRLPI